VSLSSSKKIKRKDIAGFIQRRRKAVPFMRTGQSNAVSRNVGTQKLLRNSGKKRSLPGVTF
jgi:hypothetical protein